MGDVLAKPDNLPPAPAPGPQDRALPRNMVPLVLLLLALVGMALLLLPIRGNEPAQGLCKVTDVSATRLKCGTLEAKTAAEKATDEEKTVLDKVKKGTLLEVKSLDSKSVVNVVVAKADPALRESSVAFVAVSLFAFLVLLSGLSWQGFRMLFIGTDNRLSNSKVQAMTWLMAIVVTWCSAYFIRLASGMPYDIAMAVVIPENLLALAGISGATAAVAKVVTEKKADAAPAADVPAKAAAWAASDLTRNANGDPDIGDTQMIAITGLSVLAYLASALALLQELPLNGEVKLPEPTGALVLLFGGSLGGYLVKKMAGKIGQA